MDAHALADATAALPAWAWAATITIGALAGAVNTLAGSGSLLTLPLLIFLGLPADVANGTNRIAIAAETAAATRAFRAQGLVRVRPSLWLIVPAALGALVGAELAADLDARQMRLAIGALMLAMAAVLAARPERWLHGRGDGAHPRNATLVLLLVAVGAYGGFVQAGVGIPLLAVLVLGAGDNLLQANARKVVIVLGLTLAALPVFLHHGLVRWDVGVVLALGNVAGATVAARWAGRAGAAGIRWVVLIVVAVAAAELLGLRALVAGWLVGGAA